MAHSETRLFQRATRGLLLSCAADSSPAGNAFYNENDPHSERHLLPQLSITGVGTSRV